MDLFNIKEFRQKNTFVDQIKQILLNIKVFENQNGSNTKYFKSFVNFQKFEKY